jgi:hypothetical protein
MVGNTSFAMRAEIGPNAAPAISARPAAPDAFGGNVHGRNLSTAVSQTSAPEIQAARIFPLWKIWKMEKAGAANQFLYCPRVPDLFPRVDRILRRRLGCDGNDSQRTAGAADDFQWRGDHDGACGRKLIKVGQTGQPKLAAAVH